MPFKIGNYRGQDVRPEVTLRQRYLWFFKFAYKRRAARKGILVTITDDEFVALVTGDCVYCGLSYKEEVRKVNKVWVNMLTIDRKDSSKGYISNNCVSCCKRCNTIKMDMSYDTFIAHITKILQHLGKI